MLGVAVLSLALLGFALLGVAALCVAVLGLAFICLADSCSYKLSGLRAMLAKLLKYETTQIRKHAKLNVGL